MFLRAADIVERRQEEITALLATETGCAGAFAGFQVLTATRLLRQAANWGYLPVGEVIRSDMPGTFALALRKPLGVVAGISPWNGAHVLAWRTVVNPVAFGNTVVLKPSEEAPVTAGLLVAEIMAEAGFPPGVVNVVTHAPGGAAPSPTSSSSGPRSGASTSPAPRPPGDCWPSARDATSSGACWSWAGTTR